VEYVLQNGMCLIEMLIFGSKLSHVCGCWIAHHYNISQAWLPQFNFGCYVSDAVTNGKHAAYSIQQFCHEIAAAINR